MSCPGQCGEGLCESLAASPRFLVVVYALSHTLGETHDDYATRCDTGYHDHRLASPAATVRLRAGSPESWPLYGLTRGFKEQHRYRENAAAWLHPHGGQ